MSCYDEITSLTELDTRARRHGIEARLAPRASIDTVHAPDACHQPPQMPPYGSTPPHRRRIWDVVCALSLKELYGSDHFTTPSGMKKKVPGDIHATVDIDASSPYFGDVHWTLQISEEWHRHYPKHHGP